jgi:hypothetical protein
MDKSVLITAIICVAGLEAIALLCGIDGVLLTTIIGAILLLAGIVLPTPKFLKGEDNNTNGRNRRK